MALQELEGTWEEVRAHDELLGQHIRVTVIGPQMPRIVNGKREPNYAAMEAFRKAEEFERGIEDKPQPGLDSVSLVHDARDGAMYDYEPSTVARQPRLTPDQVRDRLRTLKPDSWIDPASLSKEERLALWRRAAEISETIEHKPKPGLDSVTLVREARAGAMYGYDPSEEA